MTTPRDFAEEEEVLLAFITLLFSASAFFKQPPRFAPRHRRAPSQ